MNYSVLRNRPELRFSMETVLLFPFYRTWCLLFRLYALLRNVIQYSAWVRKFIRISTREQDMHDIPPVPYVTDPNWMTIWHTNVNVQQQDGQVPGSVLSHLCVCFLCSLGHA
jgi:hypothetical protein